MKLSAPLPPHSGTPCCLGHGTGAGSAADSRGIRSISTRASHTLVESRPRDGEPSPQNQIIPLPVPLPGAYHPGSDPSDQSSFGLPSLDRGAMSGCSSAVKGEAGPKEAGTAAWLRRAAGGGKPRLDGRAPESYRRPAEERP